MTPKKNKGILTYLLLIIIAVCCLVYVSSRLNGSSNKTEYTSIINYFDNYEVSYYELDLGTGDLVYKLRGGVRTLSALITLSLEDALDTADSMRGRGYGLKGRTAYNIFKFRKTDGITLIVTLCISTMLIVLIILGSAKYNYFPLFKFDCSTITSILFYILYAGVMLLPMIISGWEGLKWKRLRSAI